MQRDAPGTNLRGPVVVAVMLTILGAAALAAGCIPFARLRAVIDSYAADGTADPYTPELHQRLAGVALCLGVGSLILAAVCCRWRVAIGRSMSQSMLRLRRDARVLRRWWRRTVREFQWPLLALTVAAFVIRLCFLRQPMRFDEAHTYNQYASQPWFVAVSKYDAPNNHVFHSLLVHGVTRILPESEASVRVVALIAGVLLVPGTMLLTAAIGSRRAAVLAGLMVCCSSPLIEYSTNARGYTLICLLTVAGWWAAVILQRHANVAAWVAWSLAATLGCWTIPVMIYPLAMQIAWLFWAAFRRSGRTPRLKHILLAGAVVGVATVLCYVPVIVVEGIGALVGNSYVAPLDADAFLHEAVGWISETAALLFRDLPAPAWVVFALGLVLALRRGARNRSLRTVAIATSLVLLVLVTTQRVLPFPRTWLFLIPLACTLSATGLAEWIERRPRCTERIVAIGALVVAFASPLISVRQTVLTSQETGTLPDARQIIEDLTEGLATGESIVAIPPASEPLRYYADRGEVDLRHFHWPGTEFAREDRAVVIVPKHPRQTLEGVLDALDLTPTLGQHRFVCWREYPSAWVYRIAPQEDPDPGRISQE